MFRKLCFLLILPFPLFSSVYVTFTDDPATTLDVIAIDEGYAPELNGTRMYAERSRYEGHLVDHSHFRHLTPDTEYTIRIGPKTITCKTLPETPSDAQPLKIAICGDVYKKRALCQKGLSALAKSAPHAAILGGDIAYTRGHLNPTRGVRFEVNRWLQFFALWEETMKDAQGRAIPLLPCVGNHDVRPKDAWGARGKSFYAFFPQLKHSYYALTFGQTVQCVVLDTGHSEPIAGPQTRFLQHVLSQSQTPFKIACYHTPAYPSHASYTNKQALAVRTAFCPLFDRHHVDIAFEHDDHTFKRTKRIKGDATSQDGTLFLGDGCLGVPPRAAAKSASRWYLDKTASVNHFFLITATKKEAFVTAYSIENTPIDTVYLPAEKTAMQSE